jgi:hypothetical protein
MTWSACDKADLPRRYRDRRQQRQRLQAIEVVRRRIGRDELAVDDEYQVELGFLGQSGLLDVRSHFGLTTCILTRRE